MNNIITKIILTIIGITFSLFAVYGLFSSIEVIILLFSNDFNPNEKGHIGLLLFVNCFIVLGFGFIGYLALKKGLHFK